MMNRQWPIDLLLCSPWLHKDKASKIRLTLVACVECTPYTFLWNTKFYMKCYTAQKMKFPIKDFSSKCDEIRSFLQIWSHLPGKSFMENIIFYTCYMCRLNSFSGTFSYFSIMAFFRLTKISHVSFLDIGLKTKAGNHRKFLFFVYRTLVCLVPNFLIKT